MNAKKRTTNPFYPVLVVVGLAFAFTACGFAVMMVRGVNPTSELDAAAPGDFNQFFERYGFTALMIELAVLALATCGAIATDEWWAGESAAAVAKEDTAVGGGSGSAPPPDESTK